jgi:hypothetical protein
VVLKTARAPNLAVAIVVPVGTYKSKLLLSFVKEARSSN